MKMFITSLTALVSLSVFACNQEGQFIGTVKNFREIQKSESSRECFYAINYLQFNSSYICPLDIDEVSSLEFQDFSCSLKNGDQVSGVMVKFENSENVIIE
jgi:hypothetical protein